MSYPKWLYHREESPQVVNDPDEHEALGAGWEESPAAFEAEEESESEAKRGSGTRLLRSAHADEPPVYVDTEDSGEPAVESEPKRKRGKAKE